MHKLHGTPCWRDCTVQVVAGEITTSMLQRLKINYRYKWKWLSLFRGMELELRISLHILEEGKSNQFWWQCSLKILPFEYSVAQMMKNPSTETK